MREMPGVRSNSIPAAAWRRCHGSMKLVVGITGDDDGNDEPRMVQSGSDNLLGAGDDIVLAHEERISILGRA